MTRRGEAPKMPLTRPRTTVRRNPDGGSGPGMAARAVRRGGSRQRGPRPGYSEPRPGSGYSDPGRRHGGPGLGGAGLLRPRSLRHRSECSRYRSGPLVDPQQSCRDGREAPSRTHLCRFRQVRLARKAAEVVCVPLSTRAWLLRTSRSFRFVRRFGTRPCAAGSVTATTRYPQVWCISTVAAPRLAGYRSSARSRRSTAPVPGQRQSTDATQRPGSHSEAGVAAGNQFRRQGGTEPTVGTRLSTGAPGVVMFSELWREAQ